jgi:hypothetical protein
VVGGVWRVAGTTLLFGGGGGGGIAELLSVGATGCFPSKHRLKTQAFRVKCSEGVHRASALWMVSKQVISCSEMLNTRSLSVTFQVFGQSDETDV